MQYDLAPLAETLGSALKKRNWRLVCAESCTGGWVAQSITEIAGSSAWFDRGFVTYSNQSKQEMLGVKTETLQANGAVSEAVVLEMVQGALAHSHAQIAVAISGVAGPGGGSPEKPVGTVWLAWATTTQCYTQKHLFDGDRHAVRAQAVELALRELLSLATTSSA